MVNPFARYIDEAPAPEQDRSVGQYLGELAGNIPGSAAQVGKDLWNAVTSPIETAQAIGGAAVGGMQHAKDAMGIPTMDTFGDHREAASGVADFYSDRYGGGDEIADTFREDPVGGALDLGGLLTGGAGIAARAPGTAGRIAKAVVSADPVAAAGRGAARGAEAVRNRSPSNRAFIEGAPSPEQLKAQAGTLFEAAEKSGIKFQPTYYDKFVDTALSRLVDEGSDPVLSPKISRVADILEGTKGRSPSIQQMAIVRKQFSNVAGSADRAEARLVSIMVDLVDSFVESGAGEVGGKLAEARGLWSRLRKSEIIDNAIESAEAAQSGLEGGLRNEFRTLYKSRNSKKMRGFSDAELAAIKDVATGNFGANTLRRIGSMSGGIDSSRNVINLMAGSGAGALAAGPAGAIGVPLAAMAAQKIATKQTRGRADLARAVVARGETPKAAQRPQSALDQFLVEGMRRRYPGGTVPITAPVAVGVERSQDPRFRGIR